MIVNSNFDGNNGWEILNTHYPAGYSNAQYHSAFRSMRTGIVSPPDTYSYSDFRQTVWIPSNTRYGTFTMWIDPFSGEGMSNALHGAELALPFVLEALASGLPVVTSRATGAPELLTGPLAELLVPRSTRLGARVQ